MKRITRTSAIVIAAGFALVGCSSGGGESSAGLVIQRAGLVTMPEGNVIESTLEEQLGFDLSIAAVGSEYYGQLTASMAGGNAPDLFFVDRSHLKQYVDQNQVADLTPYLEDERLADYLAGVDDDALSLAEFDDKTYAVVSTPTVNYSSYWIRQDWLDNLGLPMPTTVDEFLTVTEAFAANDPDQNGQPDTYGLTGGKSGAMWTPLWAAFGSAGLSDYGANGGTFSVKDGEIVNSIEDPSTEDALEYIRSLVEAGVIDPDYLSMDDTVAQERAMQGQAGVLYSEWTLMSKPEFVAQYQQLNPDANWVQLGPLAGPAGDGAIPRDARRVDMWAISTAAAADEAKLDQIFEFLNYVSTDEGRALVSYGIDGDHYTVGDDGSIVATPKMAEEGGYFWAYQFTGRNEEEYLATKFPEQEAFIQFAMNEPLLPTYNSLVIAPETYNVGDAGAFAQENFVQFVGGQRPLSEYDDFLDQLDTQFGQADYVESATAQLEEAGVLE